MKLRQLFEQSSLNDNPSDVRNHWDGFLRWMTFEIFMLKGLSKQVRNDYIRGYKERLEARMVKEAEEKARLEAEEKLRKEAGEKAITEAAATNVESKAKVGTEEAAHIAAKSNEFTLTRGESSISDIASLVLQTLEELQKEQQLVRVRLDKQDSVNSSIQNLLTQLLQRMPPPPRNPYAP